LHPGGKRYKIPKNDLEQKAIPNKKQVSLTGDSL